jgi:hypothetical protein
MKISKSSINFIDEITNNFNIVENKKNINPIYKCLFNEINIANNDFLNANITYEMKKINNVNKIPMPQTISEHFFPKNIQKNIKEKSNYKISVKFKISGISFSIHFICLFNNFDVKKYTQYIYSWLSIVIGHKTKNCGNKMNILIYLSDEKKKFPKKENDVLDCININSAYTTCCSEDNEIVIFRKEEWFKVFMHETFHAFGLDFCAIDDDTTANKIKLTFPINSDINLTESYCEFWAETFNMLFVSYFTEQKKLITFETFMYNVKYLSAIEKTFSIIQMIKVLEFMNLTYKDLYADNEISTFKRNFFYKENTSVFSYYIIKCILMFNMEDFILWCNDNNLSLLNFYKNKTTINKYIQFIKDKYNNRAFLRFVKENTEIFKNNYEKNNFYNSAKMSLLEIN